MTDGRAHRLISTLAITDKASIVLASDIGSRHGDDFKGALITVTNSVEKPYL